MNNSPIVLADNKTNTNTNTNTNTDTSTWADKIQPVTGAGNDLDNVVINIVDAALGVLGIVCVVVIILGGVNYMTSTGDTNKVKKAKDTILYGVIGLVVCALAAVIVNFVITGILQGKNNGADNGTGTTPTSIELDSTDIIGLQR